MLAKNKNTGEFFAMKRLKKSDIIKLRQVDHVISENTILADIEHPFLVSYDFNILIRQICINRMATCWLKSVTDAKQWTKQIWCHSVDSKILEQIISTVANLKDNNFAHGQSEGPKWFLENKEQQTDDDRIII